MARIHPLACIDPAAEIAASAVIGPYCVIGPHVAIAEDCRLVAHVHVAGHTLIGPRTIIYPFASLGAPPQSVNYRGGPTSLAIGADCDIREGVTMNIGTEDDRGRTQVGDRCFFMAGSHVAHDCVVGSDVTFANNAVIGGHVEVGDHVVLGGQAAVRQRLRIGEGAMVVGLSGVRADLSPFGLASGPLAHLVGLNVIGLRRRGVARDAIRALRRAYRTLFSGPGTLRERIEQAALDSGAEPLVDRLIAFVRARDNRPLTLPARQHSAPSADDAE